MARRISLRFWARVLNLLESVNPRLPHTLFSLKPRFLLFAQLMNHSDQNLCYTIALARCDKGWVDFLRFRDAESCISLPGSCVQHSEAFGRTYTHD